MSCVNPKHPVFNKILKLTGNPLGSEILHDRLMGILSNEEQYNSYGDRLSESIAEDILLKSPALVRENPNVYSVHVVEGSNRILTFEQAYEVAKERASKINKKYSEGLRNIARVSTEKGDVRIFIEPNKQHIMDYIIKDMIAEEQDKQDATDEGYANIVNNQVNFDLRIVNNINNNLNKVKQWYKQLGDTDKFWSKVQQDLQIPKEQLSLLRGSEGNNIEEKLASFVANYSYTVEINTAKYKEGFYDPEDIDNFDPDYLQQNIDRTKGQATSYYSNLTVPGGTNYTENEIATPAITPSIKGHAQFATDNGLMWSRTDERIQYQENETDKLLKIMENSGVLKIKCS